MTFRFFNSIRKGGRRSQTDANRPRSCVKLLALSAISHTRLNEKIHLIRFMQEFFGFFVVGRRRVTRSDRAGNGFGVEWLDDNCPTIV